MISLMRDEKKWEEIKGGKQWQLAFGPKSSCYDPYHTAEAGACEKKRGQSRNESEMRNEGTGILILKDV